MKYLIALGLLFAPVLSYAQEIVLVKERQVVYAVVTDCRAQGRPLQVRYQKLERGSEVTIKTRNQRLRCNIKKVVKVA
jgi:hypothetical protein